MKTTNVNDVPYTRGWHQVTRHAWAWLQPLGRWGESNAGFIVGDQTMLVDTMFDLPHTQRMLDELRQAVPGRRIDKLVNTHADGDHWWGNQLVAGAEIVASKASAAEMADNALTPEVLQRLVTETDPATAFGSYMRQVNQGFDYSGIAPPKPNRTFDHQQEFDLGGVTAVAYAGKPAHTNGDVYVWLPEERVSIDQRARRQLMYGRQTGSNPAISGLPVTRSQFHQEPNRRTRVWLKQRSSPVLIASRGHT